MKVISQLIKHFWQRGVLTIDDANYLVDHGFIRARDLPGYSVPIEPSAAELAALLEASLLCEPPTRLEQLEESLVRRKSRRRKADEPKLAALSDDDVCELLRNEFTRRHDDLQVLVRLAQMFEPHDDWQKAISFLHEIGYSDFCVAVETAWTKRYVTFRDLWQALDLEPFHHLLTDDQLRGRAARAYSALLVVHEASALGKYAWILKHDDIQAVNNLRVLHRRLVAHLKHLSLCDVRALSSAIAQGCDLVAFWALVLLHNAHRKGGIVDTKDCPAVAAEMEMGAEYGPLPLPDASVWRSAWTAALEMDRGPVTKLFVACYRDGQDLDELTADSIGWPLYCPAGWHEPAAEPTTA